MHLTDFVVACVLSAAKEILSVSSVAKKVQEWAFYAEEELDIWDQLKVQLQLSYFNAVSFIDWEGS